MMTNENRDTAKTIKEAARLILTDEIKNLQIVPSVAIKLLNLTSNDNARIEDLPRIIETEPTLAATILKNVNSAAYALPNKITSIKHSVSMLGFSAVRQLAVNLLFYGPLIKHDTRQIFDFLFFWQHCLSPSHSNIRIWFIRKDFCTISARWDPENIRVHNLQ